MPSGCLCEDGHSGTITASSTGPLFYTGHCMAASRLNQMRGRSLGFGSTSIPPCRWFNSSLPIATVLLSLVWATHEKTAYFFFQAGITSSVFAGNQDGQFPPSNNFVYITRLRCSEVRSLWRELYLDHFHHYNKKCVYLDIFGRV